MSKLARKLLEVCHLDGVRRALSNLLRGQLAGHGDSCHDCLRLVADGPELLLAVYHSSPTMLAGQGP